jgi:hypothetical protein
MKRNQILDEILHKIVQFYGSLESPDYSKVESKYNEGPYTETIKRLETLFEVNNTTDLNDDVAVILSLGSKANSEEGFRLELSLVGEFAALFRVVQGASISVSRDSPHNSSANQIFGILEQHGFNILSEDILRTTIKFCRVNSEGNESIVYNALFSDLDLVLG